MGIVLLGWALYGHCTGHCTGIVQLGSGEWLGIELAIVRALDGHCTARFGHCALYRDCTAGVGHCTCIVWLGFGFVQCVGIVLLGYEHCTTRC